MIIESVSFNRVWYWINVLWAKSLAAFVMFFIGITSDCKFAGAFRVEIQAYNCQRRI